MQISKPTALIIPISEHNIAQLYNCLLVDFQTAILLASEKYQGQRRRFIKVLNELKPEIAIEEFDLPDDAEDYECLADFTHLKLTPLIANYQLELNGTGGTKVIPFVLLDLLPIQVVYYKGQKHSYLQRWQPNKPASIQRIQLPAPIGAEYALALYASDIKPTPRKTDIYLKNPNAISIAEQIWEQYQFVDSPMSWFAKQLVEHGWSDPKNKVRTIEIGLPLSHAKDANWLAWFEQLAAFSAGQLELSEFSLTVQHSVDKYSQSYQFQRWLSGIWLEQLVQNWLEEAIPASQLLSDVRPSTTGGQGDLRDLDFVCFHNTSGYIIETKVTHKPNQTANEMVQQLSSLADHYGKLRKVLLLSPLFFQFKQESQAKEQFKKYCQGHDVTLCTSKAELLSLFRKP